jgi:small-conductance mechanosensitive channel
MDRRKRGKDMSVFKFLPGLIVIQIATAVLMISAISAPFAAAWLLAGGAASILALVVACWFRSIADHIRKDSLAEAREVFAQERERLLLAAEAEKRTIVETSHERLIQETNRAHARASFKLGAAFVGMIGIAAAMLYIQLITLGLVMLAAAGGALGGYGIRVRQDYLANRKRAEQAALAHSPGLSTIQATAHSKSMLPVPKRNRREK